MKMTSRASLQQHVVMVTLLSVVHVSVVSSSTTYPTITYIFEERLDSGDPTGQNCAANQFRCPEDYCIPASWVCDHVTDCQGGQDERNCPWSVTTTIGQPGPILVTPSSPLTSSTAQSTPSSTQAIPTLTPSSAQPVAAVSSTLSLLVTLSSTAVSSTQTSSSLVASVTPSTVPKSSAALGPVPISSIAPSTVSRTTLNTVLTTSASAVVNNSTTMSTLTCLPGYIKCNAGNKCIPNATFCDGVVNCADYSDETSCPCSSRYGFRCKMGLCVNTGAWCNGIDDCPDSTDEPSNCFQLCAPSMFKCDNGKCVSQTDVCDGYNTCGDYSDESQCECKFFEFRCQQFGLCTDIARWCDGHVDCPDSSDEPSNCSSKCPANWIRCDGVRCLSPVYVCDGVSNCLDHSDEVNCGSVRQTFSLSFKSDVVIAKCQNSASEFLICTAGWNTVLSDLLCRQDGCNSSISTSGIQKTNTNMKYLVSQSSNSLVLQPGPCSTKEALQVECSCPSTAKSECSVSPTISWSTIDQSTLHWSPWQASVFNHYGYLCSGVIVNNQWILTAAHCLVGNRATASDVMVQVGSMHLWMNQQQQQQQSLINARDVIVHPEFNASTMMNDLALIRLAASLTFSSTIQPACLLQSADVNVNSVCVMTSLGQAESSVNLVSKYVKLMSDVQCNNMTSGYLNSSSLFSCAMIIQSSNRDTNCMRDDASPMVCQSTLGHWALYGLSSPILQDVTGSTLVLQHVTQFASWIQQMISVSMYGGSSD